MTPAVAIRAQVKRPISRHSFHLSCGERRTCSPVRRASSSGLRVESGDSLRWSSGSSPPAMMKGTVGTGVGDECEQTYRMVGEANGDTLKACIWLLLLFFL